MTWQQLHWLSRIKPCGFSLHHCGAPLLQGDTGVLAQPDMHACTM